jgi:hypothetical protein
MMGALQLPWKKFIGVRYFRPLRTDCALDNRTCLAKRESGRVGLIWTYETVRDGAVDAPLLGIEPA